jgi:fumarate hydratase subunit alpha
MRTIQVHEIKRAIAEMCVEMNCIIGEDILDAFHKNRDTETSPLGRQIISDLIKNSEIAKEKRMPLCQDTGMVVVFVTLGQEVHFEGGLLTDAINEGVRMGYESGFLRKSIVSDPIQRRNTGDNTPAVVYTTLVAGDVCQLQVTVKGFGSENMSRIKMMTPADGLAGLKDFVLDTVLKAGSNPCPPIIVGVGIGGTFEKCAQLAKQALLRDVGQRHSDSYYSDLEVELLQLINALNVGPQGLGGSTTALDVFIEPFPTHIAGLPVAVNINCHAARHLSRCF